MRHRETAEQLIKYALCGVLNCAISYAGFLVLYRGLHLHYAAAGGLGYAAGMASSFVVNRTFTFAASGAVSPMVRRFTLVAGMGITLNVVAVHVFVTALRLPPEVAQACAMLTAGCGNFVGNKLWTFRPVVLASEG